MVLKCYSDDLKLIILFGLSLSKINVIIHCFDKLNWQNLLIQCLCKSVKEGF